MTSTTLLTQLETEAGLLQSSIQLALETGDHEDVKTAIDQVRKVKGLIDRLYEIEPRLGEE